MRGTADNGGKRSAIDALRLAIDAMGEVVHMADLRMLEARAAALYWGSWEGTSIRFAARDISRVPAQWLLYGSRRSQVSASNRKASTPINALLNYAYGVLEAEARIAAHRVGCDPAMGLIHADRPHRDNVVVDLMEPVRPLVDAYVLDLLLDRTFLKADFFENREGHCRLLPPLAAALAETAPRWAKALGPVAEQVASAFVHLPLAAPPLTAGSEKPPIRLRTPLTQQNRKKTVVPQMSRPLALDVRCRECGTALANPKRTYCDACLPIHMARASTKARAVQQQLRAIGADGRQSAEVRATHSLHAKASNKANAEWEAQQTSIPSVAVYERDIAPGLKRCVPADIVRATGLSSSTAKTIRSGRMRPHPRHWDALRKMLSSY